MLLSQLPMPACATTQDSLRNSMTPQMLSRFRTSTPLIHPNLTAPSASATNVDTPFIRTTVAFWNNGMSCVIDYTSIPRIHNTLTWIKYTYTTWGTSWCTIFKVITWHDMTRNPYTLESNTLTSDPWSLEWWIKRSWKLHFPDGIWCILLNGRILPKNLCNDIFF